MNSKTTQFYAVIRVINTALQNGCGTIVLIYYEN